MSEEEEIALKVGDRVSIDARTAPDGKKRSSSLTPAFTSSSSLSKADPTGIVAFLGETRFAKGEWAGIVLDLEFVATHGKNDGAVKGTRLVHVCLND